jgi:hypothetical protein
MVKDRVWRAAIKEDGRVRYLCVGRLEARIGRRLTANDFKRSAIVNFRGNKSRRLRKRLEGCKPAKQLRHTRFTP